jgi:hypothetical protein
MRPPLRQTFTLRGTSSLIDHQKFGVSQVKSELERFFFRASPSQRGTLTMPLIEKPHLLPIPYPREVLVHKDKDTYRFSERGLVQRVDPKRVPEFLSSMPSLMRTCYDSQYLPQLERALNAVRNLKPQLKAQLGKDYAMEEDELRGEVREKLERMCEGLRMLEGDEDDSNEGGEPDSHDEDY